jgi:hypothetical protein
MTTAGVVVVVWGAGARLVGVGSAPQSPTAPSRASIADKTNGLPCVDVPHCGTGVGSLTVSMVSNGGASSKATSEVGLCHQSTHLQIINEAKGQTVTPPSLYSSCNDPIFNLDVSEAFIAPYVETDPGAYCYSEIDLNPYNVIFQSGIYNPNLTRASISNIVLDCDTSGITHFAKIKEDSSSWISVLSIPWSVINCPAGCPLESYCTQSNSAASIYRINFYRVNELQSVNVCDDVNCEYMAWSPNFKAPPSFHEPPYFGFIVMV